MNGHLDTTTKTRGTMGRPPKHSLPGLLLMTSVFGICALMLSLWSSIVIGFSAGKNISVLRHVEAYRSTVFTVQELFYVYNKNRGPSSGPQGRTYWAEGAVDGATEEFDLECYVKDFPRSREELERQVSVGQELVVFYNPDVPEATEARVICPKEDIKGYWVQRWYWSLRTAYLPLVIALGLCLACSMAARSWQGVKFAIGCLPFTLFGWIPVLLDLFF